MSLLDRLWKSRTKETPPPERASPYRQGPDSYPVVHCNYLTREELLHTGLEKYLTEARVRFSTRDGQLYEAAFFLRKTHICLHQLGKKDEAHLRDLEVSLRRELHPDPKYPSNITESRGKLTFQIKPRPPQNPRVTPLAQGIFNANLFVERCQKLFGRELLVIPPNQIGESIAEEDYIVVSVKATNVPREVYESVVDLKKGAYQEPEAQSPDDLTQKRKIPKYKVDTTATFMSLQNGEDPGSMVIR